MADAAVAGVHGLSPRRRGAVVICLAAAVGLGLLSRRVTLPGVFAEYTGDGLYCVAAFFGLALTFPAAGSWILALSAFACSAAVEAAQLLSWPWLQDLRSTTAGALVLGQGFQWADVVAYGAGAVTVGLWDRRTAARGAEGNFSYRLPPARRGRR